MSHRRAIAQLLHGRLPAVAGLDLEQIEGLLEQPKDPKLGDLAFPCFRLAKALRKAPPAIAAELAATLAPALEEDASLGSVEAAGPYINFRIARAALAAELIPAILAGDFTARRPDTGQRVMVEYSQPNTHKAFHVGHIRCAALGDSVARLIEWTGCEVVPANYIGDEGTHVAKCLWYLREVFRGEVPNENLGEFLGDLYTRATALLDLGTLTRAPLPGVRAARVLSVAPHPARAEWQVLELETHEGQVRVVCGARGAKAGDGVAWAPPGLRVAGKEVGAVDKLGVQSTGMVLSEAEAGLSDDNDRVALLPPDTAIGEEIAEVFALPEAVPAGSGVLAELRRRQAGVSEVLQAIESGQGEIHALWLKTRQWSLDEFDRIYRWLNCRFDHVFYESEFGEAGKALVREFQAQGVFVESQGAVGADLSDSKLGFCLLIKRDGTALYATRDLALARVKFERFGIERSLYVVDSAQSLHFAQVFECLRRMGYAQAEKCHHLAYGQVVLPDGKMSSRKGNVILFSELEQRLLSKIRNEFLEKYAGEWNEEELDTAAQRIALATMRYGMLDQVNASQIVFDLDEWSARTGNTGPYMLYAYTRTRSILREVLGADQDASHLDLDGLDWGLLGDPSEEELLGFLLDYPNHVTRAAETLSPQVVCAYVYELSRKLNRWYKQCSVKHAEREPLRRARLALVDATGRVLAHGLGLLGIPTIERM